MKEIDITLFDRGNKETIQHLLDEFEQLHRVHVNLRLLGWEAGWSELMKFALNGHGPDLSEVGSTWALDFARMNAINHFSPAELAQIGAEKDFFPMNWASGTSNATTNQTTLVWAIPWMADIRVAYYRRDLFEKAGVDASQAFKQIDTLSDAIRAVKATGVALPVIIPTLRSRTNLQILASWIWSAGGDFIAPDGKRVVFDSLDALRGMCAYFQMGQYIPGNQQKIIDLESDQLFLSGAAAAIFSGPWIVHNPTMAPIVRDNLGMQPMPGASFAGGTHLMLWKHSAKKEQALALTNFLIRRAAKHHIFPSLGLPAYIPAWQEEHFLDEPYFTTLFEAQQKGRSYPSSELWGLVEKRLVEAIPMIWERVLSADASKVESILAEMIVPLARRINITLE